jgi:hypothetical protein
MTTNYPVTYAKGDQRRLAHTPSDETKFAFDGFSKVDEADAPAPAEVTEDEKDSDVQPPESEGDASVDTVGTPSTSRFGRSKATDNVAPNSDVL